MAALGAGLATVFALHMLCMHPAHQCPLIGWILDLPKEAKFSEMKQHSDGVSTAERLHDLCDHPHCSNNRDGSLHNGKHRKKMSQVQNKY